MLRQSCFVRYFRQFRVLFVNKNDGQLGRRVALKIEYTKTRLHAMYAKRWKT